MFKTVLLIFQVLAVYNVYAFNLFNIVKPDSKNRVSAYDAIFGADHCRKLFDVPHGYNISKKIETIYYWLEEEYDDLLMSYFENDEIESYLDWYCESYSYLINYQRFIHIPNDGKVHGNKTWNFEYSIEYVNALHRHQTRLEQYQKSKENIKNDRVLNAIETFENDYLNIRAFSKLFLLYNFAIFIGLVQYVLQYFYDPAINVSHRLTNPDFIISCLICVNLFIINYLIY